MEFSQLRAVAAALPHAMIVIDSGGTIVVANEAACDLLGGSSEGRSFVAVIRQPAALECVDTAMHGGQRAEARFIRTGTAAESIWRMFAAPLEIAPARVGSYGAVVSFVDISHIDGAGQMRREFIANASHELRSPLTALTGFIETLRNSARDDAPARDRFLAIMEHEAERMNRLLRDLLSLSHVEEEERVRPRGVVDVPALIRATISALRPQGEEAGVEITYHDTAGEVQVAGDADQLEQVFHNLMENALKYGASGGRVEVTTALLAKFPGSSTPALHICVADHGEGIAAIHIPRLTERFYRVDSHRSREMGGTGLGLAIVKHIINRHRGRLRVESTLGEGSTFSVILPVHAETP